MATCETLVYGTLAVSAQGWGLFPAFYYGDWNWGYGWGLGFWVVSWLALYVGTPLLVAWVQLPLLLMAFAILGWRLSRYPPAPAATDGTRLWFGLWFLYVGILLLVGRFSRPCLALGLPRDLEVALGVFTVCAGVLLAGLAALEQDGVFRPFVPVGARIAWTVLYGQLDLAGWRPGAELVFLGTLPLVYLLARWLWPPARQAALGLLAAIDYALALLLAVVTLATTASGNSNTDALAGALFLSSLCSLFLLFLLVETVWRAHALGKY